MFARINRRPKAIQLFVAGLVLSICATADDFVPRHQTDHYSLAGDVPQNRLVEYGQALEFVHAEYTRLFALIDADKSQADAKPQKSDSSHDKPHGPMAPASQPTEKKGNVDNAAKSNDDEARFRVLIFQTRKSYDEFARRQVGEQAEFTDGMFVPGLKLLLILHQGNSQETYETLFHEAFHQFLNRNAPNAPIWLNEGLATFFGSAQATRNGLVFNRPHRNYWRLCRKLIEKDMAPSIEELLSTGRATFYGNVPVKLSGFDDVRQSHIYYAESYTLIHLLLSDAEGKKRLREYLQDLSNPRRRSQAQILDAHFDAAARGALFESWKRYVKSRPESRG